MLLSLILLAMGSRSWTSPTLFTQITSSEVNESSGIGLSSRYPGVLYTHNDSGDSPRFFHFKSDGVATAVALQGAGAIDWEDMACLKVGNRNLLYFGDIGDNGSSRQNIKIYKFDEPNSNATSISSYETYTVTYPDGAHNCETLIVDPNSGDIYLVTKNAAQTDVFRLPSPSGSGSYTPVKLGTIFPDTGGGNLGRLVTAGDADASGKHVMLRTYSGALEYTVVGPFRNWWQQTPARVTTALHAQGESIAYGLGGSSLFTTSEGSPCPVHRQRLQVSKGG